MPLKLIKGDITKLECDAVVNAANNTLLGGGGVDGAIHRAAGPRLLEECASLGGCLTGDAKITGAYDLPCRYVIHTVGPIWRGGAHGEQELLRSCYRASLSLALERQCESVAFPLISSGAYGYPKEKVLSVAVDEITRFLFEHDMLVYIVIFDRMEFELDGELYASLCDFIDDIFVNAESDRLFPGAANAFSGAAPSEPWRSSSMDESVPLSALIPLSPREEKPEPPKARRTFLRSKKSDSLEDALGKLDESFSEMLLRKIDERGMTDAACYKKANVDRKLFSKIRSDVHYKPSKPTAIAFAIALELSLEETKEMLMKAGFALSHSNKFDVIIEYFITNGNYNVFEINEALFAFDQSLLGA